jgi:hypothetical protein
MAVLPVCRLHVTTCHYSDYSNYRFRGKVPEFADGLFEGNTSKGVLFPERFAELLRTGKIGFPSVTVEEIEDRSKADGFSKMIALGQTLWFIAQCIARRAQHLDLTLIELLTLSLAVLNGVMYFLWWNKPLDVRCPVRVSLIGRDHSEPIEPQKSLWDTGKFYYLYATRLCILMT